MSVASQIQRIKDAVADAYTSVEEKGGTLPATENVANLATAIDSIQSGGGAVIEPLTVTANGTYTAPSGTDGYSPVTVSVPGPVYSYDGSVNQIVLDITDPDALTFSIGLSVFGVSDTATVDWGDGTSTVVDYYGTNRDTQISTSGLFCYTHEYSNIGTYTISTNAGISNRYKSQSYILNGADYVTELRLSSSLINCPDTNNCCNLKTVGFGSSKNEYTSYNYLKINMPSGQVTLDNPSFPLSKSLSVYAAGSVMFDVTCTGTITIGEYLYSSCFSGVRTITFPSGEYTMPRAAFSHSSGLVGIYGITKLNLPENSTNFFFSDNTLREIPDVIDGSSTTTGNPFAYLSALKKLPTHLTINVSFSFADSGLIEKDYAKTFAEFDENGNIVGGLVYNINTCTASTAQSATFNSNLKIYFTETEQSSIATMFTDKNWTLAW